MRLHWDNTALKNFPEKISGAYFRGRGSAAEEARDRRKAVASDPEFAPTKEVTE